MFLQCFQCSGIQKPCKILLCTMFFSFLAVFPLPESYQNDPKFHFNTLLRSDTQKSSKNVENTTVFWSRCETVFGPPAKADIATAILTNVIEHLVLLFCPPISTPSPPKRCGRIFWTVLCDFHAIYLRARLRGRRLDGPRCRPQEAAAALGLGPDNSCFLGSSTLLLAQAELGDIESCSTGSCNSQLKVFYSENLKMMTPLFSVLVLQLATTEPDQPITDAPTTK